MAMIFGITGSELTLTPGYDYSFSRIQDRQQLRTIQGDLLVYINTLGTYSKFTIPLSWVNSSDRSVINSLWETGTILHFLEDSSITTEVFTVRIMNEEEPFKSFIKPYEFKEFVGNLVLETV